MAELYELERDLCLCKAGMGRRMYRPIVFYAACDSLSREGQLGMAYEASHFGHRVALVSLKVGAKDWYTARL